MGAVTLPYNIHNGDDLDADQVMADLNALAQNQNGSLEAGANIVTATAASQTGAADAEGVSASLARADHLHAIQGFESLTADPSTGNFKGRVYYDSTNNRLRYCTDATGSGTWITVANQAATEVAVHAAQHALGGHDPLPSNVLDVTMRGQQTIASANLTATVDPISTSTFTDLPPDLSVTTTGIQTLVGMVTVKAQITAGGPKNVWVRVRDVTANVTIAESATTTLNDSTGAIDTNPVILPFFYTVPVAGARTLRVQAGCSGGTCRIAKQTSANGDTYTPPMIQVVVL